MIPDPLHPAIVHFPIVLLLLGAPLAIASVFLRKGKLPLFTAVILVLGGAGAVVAVWTGTEAAEMAGELNGGGEKVLDEHEEWGEAARNAAIIAALAAVVSAFLTARPVAARTIGAAAAVAAVVAALCVARAGHYGGQVVYKHGIGVNTAAGESANRLPDAGNEISGKKSGGRDED